MSYLPNPPPRRKYCHTHGIEYDGYLCPECKKRMEQEELDRLDKKPDKEKKDKKFQELLDSIWTERNGTRPQKSQPTVQNPQTKPQSQPDYHPPTLRLSTTDKQTHKKYEYPRHVNIIANIILLLIVIFAIGLLGGGIYGISKYHSNAWHWVTQEYHSLANNVVNLKDKTTKSASDIFHDASNSIQSAKDSAFASISSDKNKVPTATLSAKGAPQPPTTIPSHITTIPVTSTPTNDNTINPKTGQYKNYYLGLVNAGGFIGGDGCYDDTGKFVVLINNKNATNPTYSELVSFLQNDKTDEFPYKYTNLSLGFYYGTAESHVDLTRIKNIIDGTIHPDAPDVCADFAERLHNDAELAGIRCGYVSLDMTGYTDPNNLGISSNSGHACNVFETTDRGLIYIDDTGNIGNYGPSNNDMIVDIQKGKQYNPLFLFPSGGWYVSSGVMGSVTDMFVTWDGTWNN